MEATVTGINRTGTAMSPKDTQAMTEAADRFSPAVPIDTGAADAERLSYIDDADAIGSIPPPASVKGVIKTGVAKMKGSEPTLFMDKIGERIAFERAGTRLYEALMVKCQALDRQGQLGLPAASRLPPMEGVTVSAAAGETPLATVQRIRGEELAHFRMLCECMQKLGGDPTAQTPCADVTATASMGIVQVVTDPRTTLAQSLDAMLMAELADNAGWEMLAKLAEDAGESEMAGRFLGALSEEREHVVIVKGWLNALMQQGAGTPAV